MENNEALVYNKMTFKNQLIRAQVLEKNRLSAGFLLLSVLKNPSDGGPYLSFPLVTN